MTDSGSGPQSGFKPAATRLAGSVVALVRARLELAAIELTEERQRLQVRLALLLAGVVLVVAALLALGFLLIAVYWDTHRVAAVLGVGVGALARGVGLIYVSQRPRQAGDGPFAATLAELDKDRALLAGRLADWAGSDGPH